LVVDEEAWASRGAVADTHGQAGRRGALLTRTTAQPEKDSRPIAEAEGLASNASFRQNPLLIKETWLIICMLIYMLVWTLIWMMAQLANDRCHGRAAGTSHASVRLPLQPVPVATRRER